MDLRDAQWRKSSRSGGTGECVEVAHLHTHVAIRDSKSPTTGALLIPRGHWLSLTVSPPAR